MKSQDPEEKKARFDLIKARIVRALSGVCFIVAFMTDYAIRSARPNSILPRVGWPASWGLLILAVTGGFATFLWSGITASRAFSRRRASQAVTKPDSEQ